MKQQFRSVPALLVGILWLASTPLRPVQAEMSGELPLEQQVEEVAARLEGVMDTSAQAIATPNAPNVRMTTCRIPVTQLPTNAAGSIFLYQEQALAKDLSNPYRQRFLQIMPSRFSNTVRSLSYKPTNPSQWNGWCNKPLAERTVRLNQIGSPICSLYLKRSGTRYEGNTQANGCPTNVRGAVRVTNHVVLSAAGMDTWDRGFDASGKQVWGAKSSSYQYRRSQ